MSFSIEPIKTSHSLDTSTIYFILKKPTKNFFQNFDAKLGQLESLTKLNAKHEKFKAHDAIILSKGDVTEWRIVAKRMLIGFECLNYSRWNIFFKEISEIINAFLSINDEDFFIQGIGLNVVDAFRIEGTGDFNLRNLFNENSKHIPACFLDAQFPPTEALCRYTEQENEHIYRITLNMDAGLVEGKLLFRISNDVYTFLHEEIKSNAGINCEGHSPIFHCMHEFNKNIIREILTSSVLEKIGLC